MIPIKPDIKVVLFIIKGGRLWVKNNDLIEAAVDLNLQTMKLFFDPTITRHHPGPLTNPGVFYLYLSQCLNNWMMKLKELKPSLAWQAERAIAISWTEGTTWILLGFHLYVEIYINININILI